MLGVTDQDAFAALTGDQEDTLADRPNHLFIHPPRIFTKANGPRTSRAKALAYAIIEQLNSDLEDSTTEQEKAEVRCNAGRCADGCGRMPEAIAPTRRNLRYSPLHLDTFRSQ